MPIKILKSKTPEYKAWLFMKKKHLPIVHLEWLGKNGFDLFLKSMGPRPQEETIFGEWCLSRIDFNKGFTPENCKWEPQDVFASRFRRWSNNL